MKRWQIQIRRGAWVVLAALLTACGDNATAPAKADWQTDIAAVLQEAKLEDRPILVAFTGSDWCAPCQKMQTEVIDTVAFKEFADKNLALLVADTPKAHPLAPALTDQNNKLAEQYSVSEWPTYVILDKNGVFLGQKLGYQQGGPQPFIDWVRDTAKIK